MTVFATTRVLELVTANDCHLASFDQLAFFFESSGPVKTRPGGEFPRLFLSDVPYRLYEPVTATLADGDVFPENQLESIEDRQPNEYDRKWSLCTQNKLPAETHSVDFKLEYGEATIEVHKDSISKGEKILVIDDLIATGGTAEAAAKLIEISKGEVASFIFVINLFDLGGSNNLINKGYKVENLIDFPGH